MTLGHEHGDPVPMISRMPTEFERWEIDNRKPPVNALGFFCGLVGIAAYLWLMLH